MSSLANCYVWGKGNCDALLASNALGCVFRNIYNRASAYSSAAATVSRISIVISFLFYSLFICLIDCNCFERIVGRATQGNRKAKQTQIKHNMEEYRYVYVFANFKQKDFINKKLVELSDL
jgi:hypothetical protein